MSKFTYHMLFFNQNKLKCNKVDMMASSNDLKHLISPEFVSGKPPDSQNKDLQEFVQPHIDSFNYLLEDGLKDAVEVVADVVEGESAEGNDQSSISVLVEETPLKDDNGDEIEFEEEESEVEEFPCQICPQVFTDKESCDLHVQNDHKSTKVVSPAKIKCDICSRDYMTKATLKKHMQLVHNQEFGAVQKATSRCIHPDCDKVFYHRAKMIDHIRDEHGMNCVEEEFLFDTWDDFMLWKEKEEDANFVHFSKNSTHTNTKLYSLTNYTCQREGKAGYKYKGTQQRKYKDLVIGEKICPARIRARVDKTTGKVSVQYCKSHNHRMSFQDFLYRRMPDRLRNEIRMKLASGKSSDAIYKELKSVENAREKRGEVFAPSKREFVTLVNIRTIAKRMNIKEVLPPKASQQESEPYGIQMLKLLDETFNPIILYKDHSAPIEVGPEEIDQISGSQNLFLIGIQTKEQLNMFKKHGSRILFIDITDAIITPPHYIVTVKVLDENNKGYPVAYLITNSRDETVLFYFFYQMKSRIEGTDVKVNAVMTENTCNEFYALRSVFGEEVKHLLCKWNLHRAWCQKIHEECPGDEALQQELYFIFVTMLEEPDVGNFESVMSEFITNYQSKCESFITFFMANYMSQPEVWASCFRDVPEADCDEVLYGERTFDRIKKQIKSSNKKLRTVDDLLELLLKFEHESYFNRGLKLMLADDGEDNFSEHTHGLKISSRNVEDRYEKEGCWQVTTMHRDPADLQTLKEEVFTVLWKADICELDFCRERCLKLACFGLCAHMYSCTCSLETITPCRHMHKIHSMRIGVNQPTEDGSLTEATKTLQLISTSNGTLVRTQPKEIPKDVTPKQIGEKDKLMQIKKNLVTLYNFLEQENIRKYSLNFIEAGLKKVVDECEVIISIENKSEVGKKRAAPSKLDVSGFESMVKRAKKSKTLEKSAPVYVEIESNPNLYAQFAQENTATSKKDKLSKLAAAKNVSINIDSADVDIQSTNQILLTDKNSSKVLLRNGQWSLTTAAIKTIDLEASLEDRNILTREFLNYHQYLICESVLYSYVHCMTHKTNNLYVSNKTLQELLSTTIPNKRLWTDSELINSKHILVPLLFSNSYTLFWIEIEKRHIYYLDPSNAQADIPEQIRVIYASLAQLMSFEMPNVEASWELKLSARSIAEDVAKASLIMLWYVRQITEGKSLIGTDFDIGQFYEHLNDTIFGVCLRCVRNDRLRQCRKCDNADYENIVECKRCHQAYHRTCLLSLLSEENDFICTN